MIHVDRNLVKAPAVLTEPGKPGPNELEKAILHFGKAENRLVSFGFKAYKHEDVKDALDKLFHGKCAYCENHYDGGQPMEVEHWRPKGAVETPEGEELKPGYYWLAASWENLLPSCTDCNRRRYHYVPPDFVNKVKLGKQGLFPLEDEKHRAAKPGDEIEERPLLLNPCVDKPEDHLEFPVQDQDRRGIVQAKRGAGNVPSRKGEVSIEIYALNRSGLVDERKSKFLRIQKQVARVDKLCRRLLAENDPESAKEINADLEDERKELLSYLSENETYLQMARQIIGPLP